MHGELQIITGNALRLGGLLAVVLVNGFFVAAEFSFVKLRDTQLDELIQRGHRRAILARYIVRNLTSYLSATQLGITMASLGLGWLAEPVFMDILGPALQWMGVHSPRLLHSITFAAGFSMATFLQIVLGELGPKWFAIERALPTALWTATPMHWFYRASYPFNWLLNQSARWLLRRIGIRRIGGGALIHSEEELRLMLTQKRPGGSALGREIILNTLDLGRLVVHNVMRPRQEMVVLDTSATLPQCLELAERTRYSRFPLCQDGDLDKTLGAVQIKDLFASRNRAQSGADLAAFARKLIYVPETARLEKVLQLFLERKLHLAIVVDEYGGTTGLVTLEDILEELVGEIQDEFDQEKPLLQRLDENTWDLDGSLPVHELGEIVGQVISDDGMATLSGWVTQRLNGFPKVGDAVALGEYQLRVEQTDATRVTRLKLTRPPPPPASAPSAVEL